MKKLIFFAAAIIVILALVLAAFILPPAAPAKTSISVGALLPLTGKNASYGLEIQNGIELARGEINSAGGINGKELEVIYEDDAADPAVGVNGMQKLAEVDKVPIVMGSWSSGVVLAVAPIAEKNKVTMLAEAISPDITNAGDYIFRIHPSAVYYTKVSVDYLVGKKINTASVLYSNTAFGKSLSDAFVKKFEESGGKILLVESYNPSDTDYKSVLNKIKQSSPEALFVPGYQEVLDIIKQATENDINSLILATPTFESPSTIPKLGALAEKVVYPHIYSSDMNEPKIIAFERKYFDKYGVEITGFAHSMYDGTYILADILKKCDTNRECIKENMYKTDYDGVSGRIQFDSSGDPLIKIIMKTVRGGKFVSAE
ncbi:Chemotactic signal transduction system substrate-binding protein BasB [uncultured archaeon]|nr:Chemotactic signal transduction system substrate-binding protein BasB [uncultured archaeon]